MRTDSLTREKVAELSASHGYTAALAYVSSHLATMERSGSPAGLLMEARVIRAEVLQKMGSLGGCLEELKRIDVAALTPLSGQGYLLIKSKIHMQQGDLKASRVALQGLQDRLGFGSSSDMYATFLWRQAFTLALLGHSRQARRMADEHRSSIHEGGFHDANSIIYTQVLPALACDDVPSYRWRSRIEEVRRAGMFYALSNVDFSGGLPARLVHRGKSVCQALLAEAGVHWVLGNRFTGYRVGFTAALLLKHWQLGVSSEGVGEIVAALGGRAPGLVSPVQAVLAGGDELQVVCALSQISDWAAADAAYAEATEIAAEVLLSGGLAALYNVMDGWR